MQNSAAIWSSANEYIEQIDYISKAILKQAHSNWVVIVNSDNHIYIKLFTNVFISITFFTLILFKEERNYLFIFFLM